MIDEKKLILHLNDWMLQESYSCQKRNPVDIIVECIKAIEEQPLLDDWILYSEQQPKEYCYCLVTAEKKISERESELYVRKDTYIELEGVWGWHSLFDGLNEKIIAWQLLPDPYIP